MLRLDKVMDIAVRVKGEGGPQLQITMEYLGRVSDNSRFTRNRHTGQTVLRGAVTDWMEQLGWTARVYMISAKLVFRLPLQIKFQLVFPSRRHLPDVHNFHKAVCDSIKEGIGIDDVHYLTHDDPVRIEPGPKRLVVTICNAPEADGSVSVRKQ